MDLQMGVHKLSDEAVKEIISTYIRGDWEYGKRPLSKKYNVTRNTINGILRGETYQWITRPSMGTRRHIPDSTIKGIRDDYRPYTKGNIAMLMKKYKLSRNTIYRILEGKIYADVQ